MFLFIYDPIEGTIEGWKSCVGSWGAHAPFYLKYFLDAFSNIKNQTKNLRVIPSNATCTQCHVTKNQVIVWPM
jgi:hypothetical protein